MVNNYTLGVFPVGVKGNFTNDKDEVRENRMIQGLKVSTRENQKRC